MLPHSVIILYVLIMPKYTLIPVSQLSNQIIFSQEQASHLKIAFTAATAARESEYLSE